MEVVRENPLPPHIGDAVVASDGHVGRVERVLRRDGSGEAAFLVVAVRGRLRRRHPVVPCALVVGIDAGRRVVRLRGTRRDVHSLPETVPLVT